MGINEDYQQALALAKSGKLKEAKALLEGYKNFKKVRPLYNKLVKKIATQPVKEKRAKKVTQKNNQRKKWLLYGVIAIVITGICFMSMAFSIARKLVLIQESVYSSEFDAMASEISATNEQRMIELGITPATSVFSDTVTIISEALDNSRISIPWTGIKPIDDTTSSSNIEIGIITTERNESRNVRTIMLLIGEVIQSENLAITSIEVCPNQDLGEELNCKYSLSYSDYLAFHNNEISEAELFNRIVIEDS